MQIALVIGSTIATIKDESIHGRKLLIVRKADALKNRAKLEGVVQDGNEDRAWAELLEFLHEKAQQNPADMPVVSRFESEHLSRAFMLARTDPDAGCPPLAGGRRTIPTSPVLRARAKRAVARGAGATLAHRMPRTKPAHGALVTFETPIGATTVER